MEWRDEWRIEEEELDEPDDRRCFREWRRLCNSIWSWIKMREDVGSNYPSGRLPILDVEVYVVELETPEGVQYSVPRFGFYEKPMNSRYVLHSSTAMGEKPKITSLVQEVIRRLRNTSREAGQEERDVVLSKFARKLYVSGWVEGKRKEILLSGIKGYQKQLGLDQRGLRKLYRPQEVGRT